MIDFPLWKVKIWLSFFPLAYCTLYTCILNFSVQHLPYWLCKTLVIWLSHIIIFFCNTCFLLNLIIFFLFIFFLYLSLIWIHPLILHQSSKLLLRILRCRENLVSFYFPKETSSISLLTCSSLDCCFPMHILTLLYRRKLLQYLLSCNFLVFKNDCLVPQV